MASNEPKYLISVIARMLDVHPQTLRTYERLGLIIPPRSMGNSRRFSDKNIDEIRCILSLTRDLGVNLAGVDVVLRLKQKISDMQNEIRALAVELLQISECDSPELHSCLDKILKHASPDSSIRQALETIIAEDEYHS